MSERKNDSPAQPSELTHSMAHYLLTIHKLREVKGYARVTDIAKELGITKGSVSTALNNLKKKSLVEEDESKFLSLSEVGHQEVHQILSVRTLMYYFFKDVIKVNSETAHHDSCLIEHLLSEETRLNLFRFMQNEVNNSNGVKLTSELELNQFKSFSEFTKAQKGDKYLE